VGYWAKDASHAGVTRRPGLRGWIDPDGMNVEEIGKGKFKRSSNGTVLIID
jgi:hypothetical protein